VFRAAKADEANTETMDRQKAARREVTEARKAAGVGEFKKKAAPPAKKTGPSPVTLTLLFGRLILAGLAIIATLEHFLGAI